MISPNSYLFSENTILGPFIGSSKTAGSWANTVPKIKTNKIEQ
jgi:hypothetical protein